MERASLNYLINEIVSLNTEPEAIHLQNLDREKKLSLLLPADFLALIAIHKNSYRSYYSWLLNGDCRANKIRKDAALLFDRNPRKYIEETRQLCAGLLPSACTPAYSHAIYDLLCISFPKKCICFPGKDQSIIIAHLRYLFSQEYARALAGCVLYLLFFPVPSKSLNLSDSCRFLMENRRMELLFEIADENTIDLSAHNNSNDQFHYARLLYEKGEHGKALTIYKNLADDSDNPMTDSCKNEICFRTAEMYAHGDGCKANGKRALYYYEKAVLYGALGQYELYEYYYFGRFCSPQPGLAAKLLKSAAEKKDYRAIRDLGLACYKGDSVLKINRDPVAAKKYFLTGAFLESQKQSDGTCHFMLGKWESANNNPEEAAKFYEIAARCGHPDARNELLHMHPEELWKPKGDPALPAYKESDFLTGSFEYPGTASSPDLEKSPGICFSSAGEDLTSLFLMGQQKQLEIIDVNKGSSLSAVLRQSILRKLPDKEMIFYLFSEDTEQNLKDVLTVISFFGSHMIPGTGRSSENSRDSLEIPSGIIMKNVSVFVRCHDRIAELMIDSAIASLEPYYLKVNICNEFLDAANQLLFNAPCFSPSAVIYGSGSEAFWLVKTLIGTCSADNTLSSILVIDRNAMKLRNHLLQECPGIFSCGNLFHIKLYFASEEEVQDNPALLSIETTSRYYICATDCDTENISKAVRIREKTLRSDSLFENQAFIGAYCRDSQLNRQAGHLSVGDQMPGYDWYNNFNICFYGSLTQLYSKNAFDHLIYERLGWLIHENYSSPIQDENQRNRVRFHYYSCYYNHDVSRGGGLAFLYHLHALGITLPDWRDYGTAAGIRILKTNYDQWISGHSKTGDPQLELLSQREHERWNAFMLTRGWLPASIAQMDAYMQKGTRKHHLSIARLHPYIASWEDLGDENHGIQQAINRIRLRRNPDAKLSDIKELDRENIRMIGEFYGKLLN